LAAAVLLAPTPTPSARARRPIRERLPRFGSQPVPSDPGLALALDLTAAALRAGQPLSAALQLGAPAAQAHSSELARVGRLLELGAAPHTAWQSLDRTPALAQLATSARRSADSGVRLADAFGRLAAELRADARAVAEGRAHRAGVWAMAPLGFCFLPAFVCLGIVPTIAGIAGQILR
jgi:Flp pilus assembly protein TadB